MESDRVPRTDAQSEPDGSLLAELPAGGLKPAVADNSVTSVHVPDFISTAAPGMHGVDADIDDAESEEMDEDTDRRQRAMGLAIVAGLLVVAGFAVLIGSLPEPTQASAAVAVAKGERRAQGGSGITPPDMVLSHMRPLDTVYTTDSLYLDVNLAKQHVTVHFRNGNDRTFRISSGTPALKEGIATPTGMFTIQNMTPMAISKEFNDARLHHWIGIQGGVGFHGLDGNGYYGNLGVRPSSHGCVRMSREEIADMYKLVHPGALIMVHYGTPARVVAFGDPADTADALLIDSAAVYNRHLGHERMQALMSGQFWTKPQPRFVHLAHQRVRWGMEIGDSRHIPQQEVPHMPYLTSSQHFASFDVRPDRALVDGLRGGIFNDLKHYTDSVRALRRTEMKEEEQNVRYGE
ncbi:MAG: L,D-transpeptidase [Bacteroidetes bacterium]|nr:L,D-transpeptidase [Bacteroidota bacterium]